jgi:hypothetical protein
MRLDNKDAQNKLLQEIMKNEVSKSNGRDRQEEDEEESDEDLIYLEQQRKR